MPVSHFLPDRHCLDRIEFDRTADVSSPPSSPFWNATGRSRAPRRRSIANHGPSSADLGLPSAPGTQHGADADDCGRGQTLQTLRSDPSRLFKDSSGMSSIFETAPAASAIPISFVTRSSWPVIRDGLPAEARQFADSNGYAAKPGACLTLPAPDGRIAQVLFGLEDDDARFRDPFRAGSLPGLLPPGTYRFVNAPHDARLAALAFALGSYRFTRYRKGDAPEVKLVPPEGV
ncbi:MAG: hypothetical protein ACJ8H8_23660, partial [Geminicoccaceae bacterium]